MRRSTKTRLKKKLKIQIDKLQFVNDDNKLIQAGVSILTIFL